MLDINYYLRGAAGLLQKSRLATTSLPFSSSYAYSIYLDNHDFSCARILKTSREEGKGQGGRGKGREKTYLPRRRMQHAYVLGRNDMHQSTCLQIANLNKTRLKRQEIWVAQRKRLRPTFPANEPIRPRPPTMPINKKRVLRIMQKKLAIQPFNRDGHDLFPADEIERGVGLVQ